MGRPFLQANLEAVLGKTHRTVAAMLVVVLVGVNPAGGTCPVATVAISGDGASDQAVESPEVKASVGWGNPWSAPTREANKSTGCSESELKLSPEMGFPTRIGGWGRWKCRDFPYTSKASVIGEGTDRKSTRLNSSHRCIS